MSRWKTFLQTTAILVAGAAAGGGLVSTFSGGDRRPPPAPAPADPGEGAPTEIRHLGWAWSAQEDAARIIYTPGGGPSSPDLSLPLPASQLLHDLLAWAMGDGPEGAVALAFLNRAIRGDRHGREGTIYAGYAVERGGLVVKPPPRAIPIRDLPADVRALVEEIDARAQDIAQKDLKQRSGK